MRSALVIALVLAPLASACSESTPGGEGAPTLEVLSPARGTLAEASTVTVTGRATDDEDGLHLTVNGAVVAVAADGTFATTVEVGTGISIIETVAIDASGHEIHDARAVLGGALAPANGMVTDAIGARIGASGFAAIGRAISTQVAAVDFTAAAQSANPVYDNGGCLGATVNVTSIDVGGVDVALVPAVGALATDVSLDNVEVQLHVSYKVACIGGSTTMTIRAATTHVRGGLTLGLDGDAIATSLTGLSVGFTGFDLDVGGLPDVVVNLFNGILADRVAAALAGAISSHVPPLADHALAGLTGKSYTAPLLGHDVAVQVTPSQVALDADGAFIAVDTSLVVTGGEGGMYSASPAPLGVDVLANTPGLGVAIADDSLNQLFGGLWGAGALDLTFPADGAVPVATLIDDDAASVELAFALPPTMTTTDGILHLAIGDLIVTARDANGEELVKLALSLTTTLAAATSPEGRIEFAVGAPQVWAQVLAQSDRVDRPLVDAELEAVVSTMWRVIGPTATSALAGVPLPSVAGVAMQDASLTSGGGYVVLRTGLVAE